MPDLVRLQFKTDAALCRALDVHPPIISKIRFGRPVGASIPIRLHGETGQHVCELRDMMRDARGRYRYGSTAGKPKKATQG